MFYKVAALMVAGLTAAAAADIRIVEEIVAKVNGDIVTRGELERQREELVQEARRQGITGQRLQDALRQQQQDALRDQIDQLLLVQKGKDLNIKVEADVTKQMAELQVQSKISDPEKFHEIVREQTGLSYEDYKQQLTNRLLTQRVISEEISSRINVPEQELRKYYEEHKKDYVREEEVYLSQILISTEGKTPEQVAAAQKKAADLVARARRGEKFSELARDNSDDVNTARDGGSLPPYKRSDHLMVKEIENLVFSQKKGYVSDPIKTPLGLLILKVDERFEPGQASFEEVKEQVTQAVAGPRMQPKVREYLTRLRQDAFLEIKDGYVDSGAAPGKDTRWKEVAELKPQTTTKEEVAARHRKKFLGVIPRGSKAKAPVEAAPPADATGKQ